MCVHVPNPQHACTKPTEVGRKTPWTTRSRNSSCVGHPIHRHKHTTKGVKLNSIRSIISFPMAHANSIYKPQGFRLTCLKEINTRDTPCPLSELGAKEVTNALPNFSHVCILPICCSTYMGATISTW